MVKIAYVDHSFHQKTGSNIFLADILKSRGHKVDFFWDDSWKGGAKVRLSDLLAYDVVIMFQVCCVSRRFYFRLEHPNVVHVPMQDQFAAYRGAHTDWFDYWRPLQGSKVLSFSRAVHHVANAFGICSFAVRCYQPPAAGRSSDLPPTSFAKLCENAANKPRPGTNDALRGFFWLRNDDQISWSLIKTLIGQTRFAGMHLHLAHDPGTPTPALPSEDDIKKYNISQSSWFDNKKDFERVLERADVFFAPRLEEGIGQSFLEAMARGQCVAAADNATMNEYILHGVNGLLYNPDKPAALDFSNAGALGLAALKSVEQGYAKWLEQLDDLESFIIVPSKDLYCGKYQHRLSLARECLRALKRLIKTAWMRG